MEENEIVIPFDIENTNENFLHKLLRKIGLLIKATIRRIIDILLGSMGVLLLIPLSMVVFFQNLKNGDKGKIFYVQERIGKNGKIFKMYKFRIMVSNADDILKDMLKDPKIKQEYNKYRKLKFDPRLTTFGKFLRRTGLDEFPQYINVLKGEMTVVGPRPYLPEEKELMGDYYKYIIQHKPGITGIYQIAGTERIDFLDRLDMDYRYHYRKTFWTDLKIGLITILVTFRRRKTFEVGGVAVDTVGYITRNISLVFKRVIDIIGALVGMTLLIPITSVVFIGNRLCKDKGPLFYSQERIGKDGKTFKMYKFRSMIVGAEDALNELLEKDEDARQEYAEFKKLKNDPRITKMGSFIRKTSLDEFPQFINVLKGDLSLVGPRAYMVTEKTEMGDAYNTIIKCKPGVTGLWQVSGRSGVNFNTRLDMDIDYFENYSTALDLEILFKTVTAVLNKDGAE